MSKGSILKVTHPNKEVQDFIQGILDKIPQSVVIDTYSRFHLDIILYGELREETVEFCSAEFKKYTE